MVKIKNIIINEDFFLYHEDLVRDLDLRSLPDGYQHGSVSSAYVHT